MQSRSYTTGAFALRASVSVRTLRFYDRFGLLAPSRRTPAGYRQYSDADLPQLQQVQALKYLGFSLDEIRRCLAAGPGCRWSSSRRCCVSDGRTGGDPEQSSRWSYDSRATPRTVTSLPARSSRGRSRYC